jgi:hypothetical protein
MMKEAIIWQKTERVILAENSALSTNVEKTREYVCRGGFRGGVAHPARGPPLKLEKILFFGVKS